MRYKDCTEADIQLLESLISSGDPGQRKLEDAKFRHISVITSRNRYRDCINETGALKYATETGQNLIGLCSLDTLTHSGVRARLGILKGRKLSKEQSQQNNSIHPVKQRILWNLPPDVTQHKAGKLSLCIGMPVLIKKNIATELCVTNGAEATVVGWKLTHLRHGTEDVPVADVLFVKLMNPPRTIQLEGLPANVVPLTRTATTVECQLPNGDVQTISREQIDVLPNFAMTDYASQGRTRPNNVIDLTGCNSHLSYYTCFSRSSTVSGTVVVNGFNPDVIRGGAPGWLRQEFRELEILDDVTRLRERGMLHPSVNGHTRGMLLKSYLKWKGSNYIPENVSPSLRWNSAEPLKIHLNGTDRAWEIVNKKRKAQPDFAKCLPSSTKKARVETSPEGFVVLNKKRKEDDSRVELASNVKRKTFHGQTVTTSSQGMEGLIWSNNSCAFDSFFTILMNLWKQALPNKYHSVAEQNRYCNTLLEKFGEVGKGILTWEAARDQTRTVLTSDAAGRRAFGFHRDRVAVAELMEKMLTLSSPTMLTSWHCSHCSIVAQGQPSFSLVQHCTPQMSEDQPMAETSSPVEGMLYHTQQWLNLSLNIKHRRTCNTCRRRIAEGTRKYITTPDLVVMTMEYIPHAIIDPDLELFTLNNGTQRLQLAGIIYFGTEHFTARIVDKDRGVWYHDGISTGRHCIYNGRFDRISKEDMWKVDGRSACAVIYS